MLLKKGSSGEDVKKLQSKLGLGADGIFGGGTEQAVKNFQTKNGLTADGVVGDSTWKKIMGESVVSAPQVITEPAPAPVANVGSSTELLEKISGIKSDAPLCMTCGVKMRASGACYVCEGCGSTSGCS